LVPDRIEREILITAPVERVWAALTEARHLGTWFGDAGAEIDLRPGGLLSCRWQEHGTILARIERVEPPCRFSYRWAGPGHTEPRDDNSTLVAFTLTPEGDTTRLRVVESGFRDLPASEEVKSDYADGNVEGWISELDELQTYLERPAA
jgi:uncharacterized protein YndB with AHSA1/START domain